MKKSKISENFGEISQFIGKSRKFSGKIGQTKFLCIFFFEAHRKNDISAKNRPKIPKFLSLPDPTRRPNVTPLSGPTRLVNPNRFRDARLIIFI